MTCAEVRTPSVEVTDELVADLVRLGGYTHRLFAAPAAERTAPVPLPGQAVLLLMGGLVEQSGMLDDAVALLELRHTRFRAMVTAGMSLRVGIEEIQSSTKSSGRRVTTYRWTATDGSGNAVAETEAVMLRNNPSQVVSA